MLGTLRLSQPTLFEKVLFFVGLIKLCQGIFAISVTHIVPVGWVKPPAAYPARSLENLIPWWSKTFLTVMGLEWNHSDPIYPRKPPRSKARLHAWIQQLMLNILMFFYKHVGNAPLIPNLLFGEVLFFVGLIKLCQGFIPAYVTLLST